ncbi:MAG: phosphoadenosine phosphosulfate reductase [Clostridia bacterium]|nr:phosphoadenosine phosphosulfate reductase [Clostridia bacterium]
MISARQASLPGFDLGDYIRESIDFLCQYEPPEGYFVGFSGGKDSITALQLCKLAGVKHQAFYSCTRIDPPEVVRFIKREYPQVTWLYPKITMLEGIRKHGPPFRSRRWCCDHLKKFPSKNHPLTNRVMGIRAEESSGRAERGRIAVRVLKKGRGKNQNGRRVLTHYHPIFAWPEWAVWEFIESQNLVYPAMYDEGFHRIGCIVCPYILGKSPGQVLNRSISMQRWPGMWKAFEHAVKWYWKVTSAKGPRRKSYEGETAEDYWQSYLNGFEVKQ